jgi:flagellin
MDISLSAGMRSSVLALQQNASLFDTTQLRLSTGLAVNSALDDPLKYFSAQTNNFAASNLSTLKDAMGQALQTIQAANNGVTAITALIKQAIAVANQAAGTSDSNSIATLSKQYNSIIGQIDQAAADSSYNGTDLINGTSASLTVNFSPTNTNSFIKITGVDASSNTSSGLSLSTGSWTASTDSAASITALNKALTTLQSDSQTLSSGNAIIQARNDFATAMINTLKQGSSNLTAADMNQEGANMLALQTQQALATNSLRIASQASQSVLRLFQ